MKTYEKVYQLLAESRDYISGEQLARQLEVSRTAIWKAIQQLEAKGLVINSARNLGYRLEAGDLLLPDWLTQQLPYSLTYTESSASTQADARQGMESGLSAGRLYLAPSQTAAKGRFGREFYAPAQGGIYMSLHLAPQVRFEDFPHYTLLAAASIVKAIQNLTDKQPQIKWVNDIYLGQKKIAGILTEAISSVETGLITDVIIGIGLSFFITDFPDSLRDKAGSLFTEQPAITRNALIREIWSVFHTTPQEELLAIYRRHSLVLGKTVRFQRNQTDYQGRAEAVNDQGHLLVRLTDGSEIWLNSGEISLTSWE